MSSVATLIGFLDSIIALGIGWVLGMVTVFLYIRGRLMERWHVVNRHVQRDAYSPDGYEVILRKGKEEILIFRVSFDRTSSANPDTSFPDQLSQARAEAQERADVMNTHEHLSRDYNRKRGTPGGIT